jgi:hypothetical protein
MLSSPLLGNPRLPSASYITGDLAQYSVRRAGDHAKLSPLGNFGFFIRQLGAGDHAPKRGDRAETVSLGNT